MLNKTNYSIIAKYSKAINDYPLFFTFAKHNKLWTYVYPLYKEDVFQIIAMAALHPGTLKQKNRFLQKEIYHFYTHVITSYNNHKKKINQKKYNKYSPTYFNHCDVCGKDKKEYMYKSLYPGKTVCKLCYKRHKKRVA